MHLHPPSAGHCPRPEGAEKWALNPPSQSPAGETLQEQTGCALSQYTGVPVLRGPDDSAQGTPGPQKAKQCITILGGRGGLLHEQGAGGLS